MGLLFCVAVGLTATVWVVVTGWRARSDLLALRQEIAQLRTSLVAGDTAAARLDLRQAQDKAAAAYARTAGPAWWLGAHLPLMGQPMRTVRGVTATARGLSRDALPSVVAGGSVLDPTELRVGPHRIDLVRLRKAQVPLARALPAVVAARRHLLALPASWLGPVAGGRRDVLSELTSLEGSLSDAVTASQLLPTMLGGDEPRRYLVVFEGDSEVRGLGGILGGYGVLDAVDGSLRFSDFGSDVDLSGTASDVNLGSDFDDLYETGDHAKEIAVNADESPHFPYAAQIWASMAEDYYGSRFDGVVAMDPTALARMLSVIGPVKGPDGSQLTADNLVHTLDVDVYVRFNDDTPARKAFFVGVARAVAHAALHRSIDMAALLHVLGRAAAQHRLIAYSAEPSEERRLAATPLGGVLSITSRPFAEVVLNNASATKLDDFVHRSVIYQRESCAAGMATVTVALRNDAPSIGLPTYMTSGVAGLRPTVPGTTVLQVALYGTQGSSVDTATLDGTVAFVHGGVDQGHPVTATMVSLAPGQTRTLVFHVHEPSATGPVAVPVQPMAQPEHVEVVAPRCDRSAAP